MLKIFREIYLISPHDVLYNLSFQLLLILFSALFYFRRGPFFPTFYGKHIRDLDQ